MLSLMTIPHERQPHHPEWQAHRRRDPCSGERAHPGLWNFYREYAGRGGIKQKTGATCPLSFLHDTIRVMLVTPGSYRFLSAADILFAGKEKRKDLSV